MDEKKTALLTEITMLFMRYGIKSLTMDEISRQLGMSKKTLYNYVSDKKDLVKQCVLLATEQEKCMLCDIKDEEGNAIDFLLCLNQQVSEKLQNLQPAVMYDMERYYPEAWKIMQNHKQEFIFNMVKDNLEQGIEEGLYRTNIIPDIIAGNYITLINQIFESQYYSASTYDFKTLHREIARYHIRGIANENGRAYLKKKLNADIDNN